MKRCALLVFALLSIGVALTLGVQWALLLLVCGWGAHEAWFSDHLFYSPATDYAYCFDERAEALPVIFADARLTLSDEAALGGLDTLILALSVRSSWLGRFFDPAIVIETNRPDSAAMRDCQVFERGAQGVRYLNLTGFGGFLRESGLRLQGRHCHLGGEPRLWRVKHPDFRQKRVLVVAPHADDAELAAFGLYSQAKDAWIVTLTAGEIEAEHYERMGLSVPEAARLKGRLRAWDSIAAPIWAGMPAGRSIQLGYFCMRLSAMREAPGAAVASSRADLCDTRFFRTFNPIRLASDADGVPSWNNLLADLREIVLMAKPEVVVLPHSRLDPHPDHVAAHAAVREALMSLAWRPEALLCYANHLHDNDRWPMGAAHSGVALPPVFDDSTTLSPWALPLTGPVQLDKAMALAMMHDLTLPLTFKQRLRRVLQGVIVGRASPPYGENEFFRKAVRRHEVFWVENGAIEGKGR
ncbi:MAG: PIG-L family deacetylase [Azoarcus sp.]|jgi:LmbE family N-acetylglucosaminyl deacetylase|nr:PIG-L family deacetylase [Azoarcus sp.]